MNSYHRIYRIRAEFTKLASLNGRMLFVTTAAGSVEYLRGAATFFECLGSRDPSAHAQDLARYWPAPGAAAGVAPWFTFCAVQRLDFSRCRSYGATGALGALQAVCLVLAELARRCILLVRLGCRQHFSVARVQSLAMRCFVVCRPLVRASAGILARCRSDVL